MNWREKRRKEMRMRNVTMASNRPLRSSGSESEAAETRRILVLRNMCELMREMGHSDKFDDPDEWLNSIVARPR
jgi:hypothetical protein